MRSGIRRALVPIAGASACVLAASLLAATIIPRDLGDEPREVRIVQGMSLRAALGALVSAGIVRDPWPMIVHARLTGVDRRVRAGYYEFHGRTSPWDAYGALRAGRVVERTVTVVEGDTLWDVGRKLAEAGLAEEPAFLARTADPEFLSRLNVEGETCEGYLYPDTYRFPKGSALDDIISTMVARLWEKYDAELLARTAETGMSVLEVLTLASIIEKESVLPEERALISAVYHNRLKKRMRLQADPTAIYGVKLQREGVTATDIRRKTKYNTYHIGGLPPGPIASPGIASIRAALYPAEAPYLYFVARGAGAHAFSATLRDHRRAVREYRLMMRASKGTG